MRHWRDVLVLLPMLLVLIGPHSAHPASEISNPSLTVNIIYLTKKYAEPPPLSLVEKIAEDRGLRGASIAADENNRTGKFVGQKYEIDAVALDAGADVVAAARERLRNRPAIIVADLEPSDLLAVADAPEALNAIFLDIRTEDDSLREERCRANVFHILPNWAMRADALGQYLLWKKWRRWLLVKGKSLADDGYAAAARRAAARFGAKIVAERTYSFEAGSRRTDTGHQQIQTQMPLLTQDVPSYDVVFVIDEAETFGEYLLFRTDEPRPVVGTHGLVATAWHRSFEEFSAMQMQNRFERIAGRAMTERDYGAWLAVRVIGEAVMRSRAADPAGIKAYLLSDTFGVAGFKGQTLTFRRWDQQLRQPVLLAGPRALVSISPQEGFLHPKFLTDTLGFDEPESKCRLNR